MEDVGNGEIVAKRGHHENDGGKQDGGKNCDSGTARGFTQPFRTRALPYQGQNARKKRVDGQNESDEKRKTANL